MFMRLDIARAAVYDESNWHIGNLYFAYSESIRFSELAEGLWHKTAR
jgi:hypothetical protein